MLRMAADGLITTALLLTAGAGTSLQPLTENCPKCLTEVRGIPILRRLLSSLMGEGFRRLVVVGGAVRSVLRRRSRQAAPLQGHAEVVLNLLITCFVAHRFFELPCSGGNRIKAVSAGFAL